MATNPTAQFWIRTDGADTDGGGYDSAIGGGSNLCDAAAGTAVSWTSLTLAAGALTDAGATGLFTTSMIGNAVNVPGQGYYWITALVTSNHVTVTPGTGATTSFTTQPGKVGGALRQLVALNNGGGVSAPGTVTPLVPGNQINVRASGSGSVGSPDYTFSSYATFPAGDATNGYITWMAYNGTPYVAGQGLTFELTMSHKFVGLYVYAASSTFGNSGIFNTGANNVIVNCIVDMNNQSATVGINLNDHNNLVLGTEVKGGGSSSGDGIAVVTYGTSIKNCKIHGCGGWGVNETANPAGGQISSCAIYANTAGGVNLQTTSVEPSVVDGNTIDDNAGDGIKIATTAAAQWTRVLNNNITNNTGYGINVAAGTATANSAAIAFEDYNNVFHNTAGPYHNLNAGAHDVSLDPGYAAGSGAYTPTSNVAALIAGAAPIGFSTSGNNLCIGAVQPAGTGGGGSPVGSVSIVDIFW